MRQHRKLESADSQDLDGQTFMDVLDSGTLPQLKQPTGNGRDDMDEIDTDATTIKARVLGWFRRK